MGNFCSNCGNQLREGTKFCNRCGNQVAPTSYSNAQVPIPNYNQFQNGMNPGSNFPNSNQPYYGNYNPQIPNLQPYYSEPVVKEKLTWGTAVSNYWSCRFKGHCSRWEWWFTFLTFLLPINLCFLSPIFFPPLSIPLRISPIILLGLELILLFPNISLTARRLHDLNFSGWWQLFLLNPFFPTILGFIGGFLSTKINNYSDSVFVFKLANFVELGGYVIVFLFSLYFVFSSGTPGPNKYGPPSRY